MSELVWTPDPGEDPLWERAIDALGRRCSRLRREATPEETANAEAMIDRRPPSAADIDATKRLVRLLDIEPG